MDPQRLFVENLDDIEGILRSLCHRYGYRGAVGEDFCSWAKQRLIEEDYQVLRKFEGRSKITTFLMVVLSNLACDFRMQREGRWRPSAAAKRGGPQAIRLERLVYREGLTPHQAVDRVREEDEDAPAASALHRILAELPRRFERTFADPAVLEDVPSSERTDDIALAQDHRETADRIMASLEDAVRTLPEEDQVILRMHFEQAMTLADVSRILSLDQKRLYRRVAKLMATLRGELEERNVESWDVAELLAHPGRELAQVGAESSFDPSATPGTKAEDSS